jgi:hypothetical protein
MTTRTILAAFFMSGVIGGIACSRPEQRSRGTIGTAGTAERSTVASRKLTEEEARRLAIEAVVYGYPLVLMHVTERVQTNVVAPQHDGRAPINQFSHFLKYPTAAYRDIVRMNVDTLYSFAWLDLSKEPLVLSVPDTQGRYYLLPILDAWTNVFTSPGKRTTGTGAGHFAIVGPTWTGTLPAGMKELKSPTNTALIAGRTQANGPPDFAVVNAIQKQYRLTPLDAIQKQYELSPLSAFGKLYTPPQGVIDPQIDMKTPPVDQVNRMSAAAFFTRLAALMASNPQSPTDARKLARLAAIGVVPGHAFDTSTLDPAVAKGLDGCVQTAVAKLGDAAREFGTEANGWRVPPMTLGNFETDYGIRAAVALVGVGANLAQDAVYPTAFVDASGQPLNGANRYVLHFDKGAMPPVNAFWSLTMYNAESFLVDNPINRYNIAGWMPLTYNPDGSLDVFIQHGSPGRHRESNWLPAAEGPFSVTLRMYWPSESVLKGAWRPPGIQKVTGYAKGTAGG